jgi:hypothetical protein
MDHLNNYTNFNSNELSKIDYKILKKRKLLENINSDIRKLNYKKMKIIKKSKNNFKKNNNKYIVNHLLDNMNCLMINSNRRRSKSSYNSDSSDDEIGF